MSDGPDLAQWCAARGIDHVDMFGMYEVVPVKECWMETGKPPIGTRRSMPPRSLTPRLASGAGRLPGTSGRIDKTEDSCAATPPLGVFKCPSPVSFKEGLKVMEVWRCGQGFAA